MTYIRIPCSDPECTAGANPKDPDLLCWTHRAIREGRHKDYFADGTRRFPERKPGEIWDSGAGRWVPKQGVLFT